MDGPADEDDWYFDHVIDQPRDPTSGRVLLGPLATWDLWWADQSRVLEREWPALVATATKQGFVLMTQQLTELGVPRHVSRRLVRRGTWSVPRRGTVAVVTLAGPDRWVVARRRHALDCAAAALLNPDRVIGDRSAAILRGLPTMHVPTRAELTAPAPRPTWRAGLRIAGLEPPESTTWWGIPVTSVARTIVDRARHDRRDGLMAADAALHENAVRTDEIDAALRRSTGWPGIRRARAVLALASPEAESALESLVRLALHDSGFPAPELQVVIRTAGRRQGYRVDFVWPGYRLIVEADGRVKYRATSDEPDGSGWQEKKRETALRRAGFEVERVLWDDVVRSWPATEARLRPYFR
jgi:very-short-patch-repair endonuclease